MHGVFPQVVMVLPYGDALVPDAHNWDAQLGHDLGGSLVAPPTLRHNGLVGGSGIDLQHVLQIERHVWDRLHVPPSIPHPLSQIFHRNIEELRLISECLGSLEAGKATHDVGYTLGALRGLGK
jgi:hypothetical protein